MRAMVTAGAAVRLRVLSLPRHLRHLRHWRQVLRLALM
jgi:hypothetical protein